MGNLPDEPSVWNVITKHLAFKNANKTEEKQQQNKQPKISVSANA